MQVLQGQVKFINEKNGIYSIKMDDGNLYGFYKSRPQCNEGDNVEFSFTQRGRYNNADPSSLKVVGASSLQTTSTQQSGGSNTQDVIRYQAARNSALEFINIALTNGAVKLPAKQADSYDALMGLMLEVTDQFYEDAIHLGNPPPKQDEGKFAGEEE